MKIAVAQMNTRAGDFDATVERMLAYGRRAKSLGADLLVFPVPALMGLEPGALTQAEAYVADAAEAMTKLAHGLEVPSLVPFMFDADGMTASDVALVRDGETIPLAFATWLSGAGDQGVSALAQNIREASGTQNLADEMIDLAEEVGPASSALGPAVVQISGVDVGIALTYDDLDSFALGDAAADVVCYLPMDGFNTDDEASCLAPAVADGCFLSEASEANSWLVAANAVGAYEDAVYCGGSFVLSPWGELAAAAPSFVEDLLVCGVDVLSEGPLAEAARPAGYDRSRFLWDACALATRDQVEKRGLAGAAVVLDGTLSSAAVAALAVDALGPMRVSALVCTQDGPSLADARATARSLRIRDVDELSARELERAVTMLGGEADASELAAGLVQARLGSMARAGSLLALSADDKTSLAVGLGEGSPAPVCRADAFAPFGDVYRSDVQRLARYRNAISPVIALGSVARVIVPSGLGVEEGTTRPELAVSRLDAVLLTHVDRGGTGGYAISGLDEDVVLRILARVRACEAARRSGPRYPVVSARSLGEMETPVADAWRDRGHSGAPEAPGPEDLAEALDEIAQSLPSLGLGGSDGDGPEQPVASGEVPQGLSEVMGFLQDLSAGNRLRRQGGKGSGGAPGSEGPWFGLFSDN